MPLNRYYYPVPPISNKKEYFRSNPKCIFISYQSADRDSAKLVADFFINLGVDVYFDQYDEDLRLGGQLENPKKLVDALCKGIDNSSHMVVVISPNTMQSKWVPFEIGFGFDKTEVIALCLKGIPKGGLPEYLRVVKVIRDLWDLNYNISKFTNKNANDLLKAEHIDIGHSSNHHPLYNIMDSIINEKA